LKDNEKLILVYSTIGSIYKSRGEQEDALKFFNIAIASAEKIEDFQSLCVLQINSGNIYADIGETTIAIENYENAMINAQEIDYRQGMKDAFEKLYLIYEVEDDLESAYIYYQLFINVRDSLQKRENVAALVTTEMEYKFDKERVKIRLEQEKNELFTAEKDKRQNLIILAIIVLLLGTLIIVFLIYKSNKEKQKANEQLLNQNLIIEKKQTELLGSIDHAKRIQKKLEKSLIKEKELGQLKASFVTVASHQFRTPLAVIQSNAELLEMFNNMDKKQEPENYAKATNRITVAISKMTDLMDDVLTLGKLTSGNVLYSPEKLDLIEFCKKIKVPVICFPKGINKNYLQLKLLYSSKATLVLAFSSNHDPSYGQSMQQ
jgi:signal transduction histidine kinase